MALKEICLFFEVEEKSIDIQAIAQEAEHTWNFHCHTQDVLCWEDASIIKNSSLIGHVNEIDRSDKSGGSINITFDRTPNGTQLAQFIETCVSEAL